MGAGINLLLVAHFGAPEAHKRYWSILSQEARIERALRYVVDMLCAGSFLAGAEFTLSDISASCSPGIWQGALGKPLPEKRIACRERLAMRPAYQRARKAL